jgi:hypothetical protein
VNAQQRSTPSARGALIVAVSDWLGVAMYKGVLETVKQRLTLAWFRLVQQV